MKYFNFLLIFTLCTSSTVWGSNTTTGDILAIPLGYALSLSVHELGHAVVARNIGARGLSFNINDEKGVNFFGATTTVESIEKEAILPFALGGEIGADFCFEYGLAMYRKNPTLLNKSILLFSGTDFLRYSLYTFYIDKKNNCADPYIIQRETNLRQNIILTVAFLKTLINAHRVITNRDIIIPFFSCDKNSVKVNLMYTF